MENAGLINIVATECKPEDEARFNKWYDEVHVPMLLEHPNLKKVTRYKLMRKNPELAPYLAIYEFESAEAFAEYNASPEHSAAIEEMSHSWKEGDIKIRWVAPYEPIKQWEQ